jgi:hypothetical protein
MDVPRLAQRIMSNFKATLQDEAASPMHAVKIAKSSTR